MTSSATLWLVVYNQAGELYPCSACPTKSTATISASASSSAITAISVGPANKSIPTLPNKILLASATNWFPGPTKISAGGFLNKPFVIAAIPGTPPKFKITSAPHKLAV